MDWDGLPPSEHYDGRLPNPGEIVVPTTGNPLNDDSSNNLLVQTINPLRDSEVHGVDIYLEAISFLQHNTNQ